jgi:hypothetical protein
LAELSNISFNLKSQGRNKMRYILFLFLFILVSLPQLIFAQIPKTMSYQGVLTDNSGSPVPDGQVSLTFKLYNVVEEGQSLWEETQSVQTKNGLFNVILGNTNPLNLTFDEPYWLGITIEQENEMIPRSPLTSSPYSLGGKATLVQPEAGQGLILQNTSNETTHKFNTDGSGMHSGTMTFLSNIVVGDSVFEIDTTGLGLPVTKTGTSNFQNSNNINSEKYFQVQSDEPIGIYSTGKSIAIYAESEDGHAIFGRAHGEGHGVRGNSEKGIGVSGFTPRDGTGVEGWARNGIGVLGRGPVAGVYAEGKLKVDDVPNAPNQDKFLVWDTDNFVKYRTLPDGNGSLDCATCVDGTLNTSNLIVQSTTSNKVSIDDDGIDFIIVDGQEIRRPIAINTNQNSSTILPFEIDDANSSVNAININYGGNGKSILGSITNPTYNNNFFEIKADPNIRNFNMAGIGFSSDFGGTNITGAQFVASKIGAQIFNNSLFDPALGVANLGGDATAIATSGHLQVNGNGEFTGLVIKAGGSFKIDHPLDPQNKYLYHSFVESPQRMNVYNGNVILDNNGEAIVELPDYFEALNKDFRYQLTCIGGFAQVYIAQKISESRFKIAGGIPNLEISWQVTGVRKDAYAKLHPLIVEQDKPSAEKGRYLHPEAFGLAKEEGTFYSSNPRVKEMLNGLKDKIPPVENKLISE